MSYLIVFLFPESSSTSRIFPLQIRFGLRDVAEINFQVSIFCQHFTLRFFAQKCFAAFIWACNFCGKKIAAKGDCVGGIGYRFQFIIFL